MLKESLNKWLKIDPVGIVMQLLSDRAILKFIEDANREQLLKGKNSLGVKLSDIGGGYSELTLKLHPKKEKDKVTLLDTSEFHDSITAKVDNNLLRIDADPFKTDDYGNVTNLFSEWGEEIIGITDEDFQNLIDKLTGLLINEILKQV